MSSMKHASILVCAVTAALVFGNAASAQQIISPGGSQFNPPLPTAPPPPKIEVPAIPQMDAPPSRQIVQPAPRSSFSDRIHSCLEEGAAAGLGPNQRAAYSRSCANQ
jgi:hypothetical protein